MLRRILTLVAAGLLAACGGSGGGSPGTPGGGATPTPANALPAIPEVTSVGNVATLTLTGALDAGGRPAFFWQGQETAPTIRVHPGDTIHLHYINNLPLYCGVGVVSNSNLHFHGLSSAPLAPGDEVIATNAAPGSAVDYTIAINPDQPPGLYFYHAHPHLLTTWEVGNGMAGMIVVEGIADEIPSLAGLRERVIVLRDIPDDPTYVAQTIRRMVLARRQGQGENTNNTDPCAAESGFQTTINGLPSATIGIRPGELQLWRILNGSGHRHFDLTIPGSTMTLVAVDGVPLGDYAGAASPQQTLSDVVIPPAGRAEVVVTGPFSPAPLISKCYDSGATGDVDPEVTFGELADDGGGTGAKVSVRVARPLGLRRPRLYRQPLPAPAAKRFIALEESGSKFYIDGTQYDPSAPPTIVAHAGTVEEWTIDNVTGEVHAFHTHQVHFIVESTNGIPEPAPYWRDVVDVPPPLRGTDPENAPSTMKILVDFRDPTIRGTFLFHCHILDHEDGGMMAKIQVI
ncbi:MAG: multicopper oxidase family protein [Vulcanimicrobiaceae bacterium]